MTLGKTTKSLKQVLKAKVAKVELLLRASLRRADRLKDQEAENLVVLSPSLLMVVPNLPLRSHVQAHQARRDQAEAIRVLVGIRNQLPVS